MAEESRMRKNSALQELKRIQQEDRAAGIHYEEPELRHFDAQSVFDMNKKQAKPERKNAFHLAKRTQKAQHVEVHKQALENGKFEVEDLSIQPKTKKKRKTLKRSQAKNLDQETKVEEKQSETTLENTEAVVLEEQKAEPSLTQEPLVREEAINEVEDKAIQSAETGTEQDVQIVQPGLDQEEDVEIQVEDLTEESETTPILLEPEVVEEKELSEEELEKQQLEAFKARQVEELKKSLASAALEEKEVLDVEAQKVDEVEDIVRPIETLSFDQKDEEVMEEVKEDVEPKSVKETFDEMKRNSEELRTSLRKKILLKRMKSLKKKISCYIHKIIQMKSLNLMRRSLMI